MSEVIASAMPPQVARDRPLCDALDVKGPAERTSKASAAFETTLPAVSRWIATI